MVQTQHSEGRSYVLVPAWVKGRKKHRAVAKGLIGKVDMIVTEGTPVSKANNVLIALSPKGSETHSDGVCISTN